METWWKLSFIEFSIYQVPSTQRRPFQSTRSFVHGTLVFKTWSKHQNKIVLGISFHWLIVLLWLHLIYICWAHSKDSHNLQDAHMICPLQQQTLGGAASIPGDALRVGVQRKLASHLSVYRKVRVEFIPIVAEALGGLAEDSISIIQLLGRAIARKVVPHQDSIACTQYLFHRVAFLLWQGNASLWFAVPWEISILLVRAVCEIRSASYRSKHASQPLSNMTFCIYLLTLIIRKLQVVCGRSTNGTTALLSEIFIFLVGAGCKVWMAASYASKHSSQRFSCVRVNPVSQWISYPTCIIH